MAESLCNRPARQFGTLVLANGSLQQHAPRRLGGAACSSHLRRSRLTFVPFFPFPLPPFPLSIKTVLTLTGSGGIFTLRDDRLRIVQRCKATHAVTSVP